MTTFQDRLHGQRASETTLKSGFDALLECRHQFEHCIAAEHRNPTRNAEVIHVLEREMGRVNGELMRYDGLLRALSRGRVGTRGDRA